MSTHKEESKRKLPVGTLFDLACCRLSVVIWRVFVAEDNCLLDCEFFSLPQVVRFSSYFSAVGGMSRTFFCGVPIESKGAHTTTIDGIICWCYKKKG